MVGVSIRREYDESWRDCAKRYARAYGLEYEVLEYYDNAVESGMAPEDAAFEACIQWDVLDLADIDPSEEPLS